MSSFSWLSFFSMLPIPMLVILHLLTSPLPTNSILPQNIPGQYRLELQESKDVECARYIRHTRFAPTEDDDGNEEIRIFHNTIYHNGEQCDGRPTTPYLRLITAETFIKNRREVFAPNQTELEKALIETNSIFGIELLPRVCPGGGPLDAKTFVAFVQNATSPKFLDLKGLEENKKYMLIYSLETKKKNRCLYRDPNTRSVPGLANDGENSATKDNRAQGTASGACFPAMQLITLHNGKEIMMKHLTTSHKVRAADGSASPIFTFSHREHDILSTFIKITTDQGNTVRISPGHYIYVNGNKLRAASTVRVGDQLQGVNGLLLRVTNVELVKERGMFAPHSMNDELVVGGMRVSTFTTAVHPRYARMLLRPAKVLHALGGVDALGGLLDYGAPNWMGRWTPKGPDVFEA